MDVIEAGGALEEVPEAHGCWMVLRHCLAGGVQKHARILGPRDVGRGEEYQPNMYVPFRFRVEKKRIQYMVSLLHALVFMLRFFA